MATSAFAVRVDVSAVRTYANAVGASLKPFQDELNRALVQAGMEGQVVAKNRVSVFTGTLANSIMVSPPQITSTKDTFNSAVDVYTDQPYAPPVEYGRGKNKKAPPYAAIRRWVELKMLRGSLAGASATTGPGNRKRKGPSKEKIIRRTTFAVMRKIARDGIEPQRFMERGYERAKDVLEREADRITNEWIQKLGGP